MLAGALDLGQVILQLRRFSLLFGEGRVAYDGIHGRADVMRHVEEELAFCEAPLYSSNLLALDRLVLDPDQILNVEHDDESHEHDEEQDATACHQRRACCLDGFALHDRLRKPHQRRVNKQGKQHDA